MRFESLNVQNLMGCIYYIEFDPGYTTVIGENRAGKTLIAKSIMLALYGTGYRDTDVHWSWKISEEGLGDGYVELIFKDKYDNRYKIRRDFSGGKKKVRLYAEKNGKFEIFSNLENLSLKTKEDRIKEILEQEVGVTPLLMNVVMSNEKNQPGMISYDEKLQQFVWQGWEWKSKILKDNIQKCANKCDTEIYGEKGINSELLSLGPKKDEILKIWQEKQIFKKEEVVDKDKLDVKLESIASDISQTESKNKNYKLVKDVLNDIRNMEDVDVVKKMIELCEGPIIDEKEEVNKLYDNSKKYLNILENVINQGMEKGINDKIVSLGDELKKLESSKNLKDRDISTLKEVKCTIYPPDQDKEMFVQIPDEVSNKYSYSDMDHGKIAIKWSLEKENDIKKRKTDLETLLIDFGNTKKLINDIKDDLREKVDRKHSELFTYQSNLTNQKESLDGRKKEYIDTINKIKRKEELIEVLSKAGKWFSRLHELYNEEENRKIIRENTRSFINTVYSEYYKWDRIVEFKEEEGKTKMIVKDLKGKIIDPSGAEGHVIGLAWRWNTAEYFELPLVLDEVVGLLDDQNFEKTKKLIVDWLNKQRQIVILTYKEGLANLPGKIYRVRRDDNDISTITEINKTVKDKDFSE